MIYYHLKEIENNRMYKLKFCGDFAKGYESFLMDYLSHVCEVQIDEKQPDFLISDCFNSDYLKYDCVRILLMGENVTPDFNLFDYAIAFDHLEYGDRYLRFPLYALQSEFTDAMKKHLRTEEDFLKREKFCNFIFSDSALADSMRVDFFNELNKYKAVDSGGGLLNNIGYRVKSKMDFMKDYKFSIAFENSSKAGYVTEKILHAFAAGTIPIYWGAPDVCKDFNPKSFINVNDYNSFQDVIARVKELDNDSEKYLAMCKEPIFTENSLCKKYYENSELAWDYIADIIAKGPESARRIYNRTTGLNKVYTQVIQCGWDAKRRNNSIDKIKRKIALCLRRL